jgi:Right handed beta helix region
VTIRDSYFHDFNVDGIQTGRAINVIGNEFARLDLADTSAHSDAIQLYCGCGSGVGSLVKGNYAHDGEQGIVAFDGSGSHVIEDNVVWNFRVPHGIVLGGDRPGSTVRHNAVGPDEQLDCSSKSGFLSSQTAIYDNIGGGLKLSGGVNCAPARNDHNMLRSGASGQNVAGIPIFVGGVNSTS